MKKESKTNEKKVCKKISTYKHVPENEMIKAVVTAYGEDKIGIVYNICDALYKNNANIIDITQDVLDGYFNMMIIVDISRSTSVMIVKQALEKVADRLSIHIHCQLEETFLAMHRV